ncbi:predicted protein, partial [Nematostella vectensis]
FLLSCATCKSTDNQHLMAECDTCHNFYHLACVDPPLSRMPRKSAKCLWQCSECDPSESEEDVEVDVEDTTPISQSRQKRTIKEPTKFTPDKGVVSKEDVEVDVEDTTPISQSRQKRTIKEPTKFTPDKGKLGRPRTGKRKQYVKKEKIQDERTQCSQCDSPGDNTTLVRCDNCKLCYHFGCLDPPVKSNPKKRGYMWYCTECDESVRNVIVRT